VLRVCCLMQLILGRREETFPGSASDNSQRTARNFSLVFPSSKQRKEVESSLIPPFSRFTVPSKSKKNEERRPEEPSARRGTGKAMCDRSSARELRSAIGKSLRSVASTPSAVCIADADADVYEIRLINDHK
jgi:hypothetical protein